jgi:broad specificity phosphatase PhoE
VETTVHPKRIQFIALRNVADRATSVIDTDRTKTLSQEGLGQARSLRMYLEAQEVVPTHAFVSSAVRTQQTASEIAPDAPQTIIQGAYPTEPVFTSDELSCITEAVSIAYAEVQTSAISWNMLRKHDRSGVFEHWITILRDGLYNEFAQLSDGDTVLAVGHGSSMLVAVDQSDAVRDEELGYAEGARYVLTYADNSIVVKEYHPITLHTL